jgi:hypothetical protein
MTATGSPGSLVGKEANFFFHFSYIFIRQERVAKAQKQGKMASVLSTSTVARGLEKALYTAASSWEEHFDRNT